MKLEELRFGFVFGGCEDRVRKERSVRQGQKRKLKL